MKQDSIRKTSIQKTNHSKNNPIKQASSVDEKKGFFARITPQISSKMDASVLMIVTILSVLGTLYIFSTSASITATDVLNFSVVTSHLIYLGIGIILATIIMKIDIERFKVFVPISYLLMMVVLLLPFFQESVAGTSRWLTIGGFKFQPSELLKPIYIVYLALLLAKVKSGLKDFVPIGTKLKLFFQKYFLNLAIVVGTPIIIISVQRDLGTVILLLLIFVTMFYFANIEKISKLLVFLSVPIILFVFLFGTYGVLENNSSTDNYRANRIFVWQRVLQYGDCENHTDEDFATNFAKEFREGAGYQLCNTLIAIGRGGAFGVGLGNSKQKLGFLGSDISHTDAIIAIIAEESGFVAVLVILTLFLALYFTSSETFRRIEFDSYRLMAFGIIIWIVMQAYMNIGGNLAVIPFKGLTIPFISYGGSSTIACLIGIGLYANVSRYRNLKDR
jgi:cell division protein FtsW